MAYTVDTNQVMFQRLKNFAVAAQNLAEEAARLRAIYNQEAAPFGNPVAAFDDTDIATVSEAQTFQSYLADFIVFHNGGGTLSDAPRGIAWALPFINTTPA